MDDLDDRLDSRQRAALEAIAESLQRDRMYSYLTLDQENRWIVACDAEEGHIDVRIGADGFDIDAWATSPGLFWDEEDERHRIAKERLARVSLPAIARGFLLPSQEIWWDESDHGVGARVRHQLPFSTQEQLSQFALTYLAELNDLIAFVETKLVE
jgi:hypothetical protein